MNITRKTTSIILSLVLVLLLITGCNSNTSNNNVQNLDYSFWKKDNSVRMTLPISMETGNDETQFTGIGKLELSKKYLKRVEKLKTAMVSYFSETYNMDISKKIENQQLRAFSSNDVNGSMTMGYVDYNEPEYLNLNNVLFSEYKDYFDNTYIHETLHQIGFRSKDSTMITEGIVDALTDLILSKAEFKSFPTENYADVRTLGYQILAADKDIAQFYLENDNPSMISRISEKLQYAIKPYENIEPGERLECLAIGLTQGFSATFDAYYIAFEAQEIVRAYCQSFNPSNETIDYIRSCYLVENYENIAIKKHEDAYEFCILNE